MVRIHFPPAESPCLTETRPMQVQNRGFRAGVRRSVSGGGETDRAAAELAESRMLLGEGSFSSIAQLTAHGYWGVPKVRTLFEATYLTGLRKAGLPEE